MKKFLLISAVAVPSCYVLSRPSFYEERYGTNIHQLMHWSNLNQCTDKSSQYVWVRHNKDDRDRALVIGHLCSWCNHVDVVSYCDTSDDSNVTPFIADSKYNGKYWTSNVAKN